MDKVYISRNYPKKFIASTKAKLDAEAIVEGCGFRNVGLRQINKRGFLGRIYRQLSIRLGMLRLPPKSILFLQCPNILLMQQVEAARKKGCTVVILVHDINVLRQMSNDSLEPLRIADVLIVHTPAMKQWFVDNGFTQRIEVLQIFDYLTGDDYTAPRQDMPPVRIAFAGNLGKSKFLSKLSAEKVRYRLFGVGADGLKLNPGVEYCGCYPPEQLSRHLDSDFGLVWDGTSVDTCDGIEGEYLHYIAPHKTSMYLSAGIPVIVWDKSAMAGFVRENGVGIAVGSLAEIEKTISEMSPGEYARLKTNAETVGARLRSGHYLRTILGVIASSSAS